MRKFTLVLVLSLFATWSYAQVNHGISWVSWADEPAYEGVTGYDANPFENPEVTIYKAPSNWTPATDVASFDATWELLEDENFIANPTNIAGGDLYDLDGDATFGASWKGIHDGENFYIFLKHFDVNGVVDAASKTFEIMAQPTGFPRHEPTFLAASDSTAANTASGEDLVLQYQNQAYGRSIILGGGKAVFANGAVTEYNAAEGKKKNDWQAFFMAPNWSSNEAGMNALMDADHFWDETDGVIRAVMVMSLDGALSYPTDIEDPSGERTGLSVGDTFSFDVKSNAAIGEDKIEYFWSSDVNNGYASNYYSGHLTLSPDVIGEEPVEADFTIHGISWVSWADEPAYEGVTGYDANPYENPEVSIFQAPEGWAPVTDVASFDATWDLLGDERLIANPTNVAGGDLFDLEGDATFGASWKGVHDGVNFYIFMKYFDVNGVVDAASKTFEIMAQPTGFPRHEPTFLAASDSTAANTASGEDLVLQYQNQAYGRTIDLGGGKAVFSNGAVTEYNAAEGKKRNDWQAFFMSPNWSSNEAGMNALMDADHFWDETEGVIRAVMVMSLDEALSYPNNPADVSAGRTGLKVGDTFSFDIKSNAAIGEDKIEYFWSSDVNNGYASNYYSGHLTLVPEVVTSAGTVIAQQATQVYLNNGTLFVKGNKPVNLEVYSIMGAKIKEAKNVSRLSMQEMQNGIYLIRVNNENTATKVVKF